MSLIHVDENQACLHVQTI